MFSAFLIGLIIAALPGPGTMLFMRYVLEQGLKIALYLSLGIIVADIIYAIIAGLGISLIAQTLLKFQNQLHGISGIFLIGWGIYETISSKRVTSCDFIVPLSLFPSISPLGAFMIGFLLIFFNPLTILMFMGIFSSFPHMTVIRMIIGICTGSMVWWIFLGYLFVLLRKQITSFGLLVMKKIAGMGLLIFGMILLFKSI